MSGCLICQTQHPLEKKALTKEVTGLKQDVIAEGFFCPELERWVFQSKQLYQFSNGVVTFKQAEVVDV